MDERRLEGGRLLKAGKLSQAETARQLGVSRATLSNWAKRRKLPIRQAAWYHKTKPTFSDALALVRWQIWQHECFQMVGSSSDNSKLPAAIQNRLLSALGYTP